MLKPDCIYVEGALRQCGLNIFDSNTPTTPSMRLTYIRRLSHEYVAFEINANNESWGVYCNVIMYNYDML